MFVFTVCQVGAEPALKNEITRLRPDLKFAYSRPGFVTFKRTTGEPLGPDLELQSVFARAYGLSLGKSAGDPEDVIRDGEALAAELGRSGRVRLHVFERDFYEPGEEPKGFTPGERAASAEKLIRSHGRAGEVFFADSVAEEGDSVLDVVLVEEGEWWLGTHVHRSGAHSADPGGKPSIELPAEAPSRAYLKIAEALRWTGAPIREGDQAVEIGSAPGGASWFLLESGLDVTGIDPAEMDWRVLAYQRGPARFKHVRAPVNSVLREDLPDPTHWLLMDMNVSPAISMFSLDRLATRMRDGLLGMFLTIKLNDWKMASEIPSMLEHVQAMGMVRVRARQLAYNRREIFVYGLTKAGLLRKAGGPTRIITS